jgi:DNA-binding GntR family transcriptional regulator
MSPEPVTAQYTYERLKVDIVTGGYAPGRSLNLHKLAQHFGTSVTPVRDAIHRMVGERLVDLHPGGGFRVPVPTAASLHGLYRWHDVLVRQALTLPLTAEALDQLSIVEVAAGTPDQIARAATRLFEVLVATSGTAEFLHALGGAADRLRLARLCEPVVMREVSEEMESFVAIAKNGSKTAIRTAIAEYHRRRLRRCSKIAAVLVP